MCFIVLFVIFSVGIIRILCGGCEGLYYLESLGDGAEREKRICFKIKININF